MKRRYVILIRKILRTIVTIGTYGLAIFTLFFQHNIIPSMGRFLAFFVTYHFAYLERKHINRRHFFLGMIGITFVTWLLVGTASWQILLAVLLINVGIVMLTSNLHHETLNTVRFNTRTYATKGGYIFTVFITVAYSLVLIGFYDKFPFTCERLSDASSSVVDTFAEPFALGYQETVDIKNDIQDFFNTSVGDVVTSAQSVDIQAGTNEQNNELVTTVQKRKQQAIDNVLKQNSSINNGICTFIIGEINDTFDKPAFQFSVLLLLFILLVSFIRITFWVMSIIAFIVLKLLLLLRIYRRHKIPKPVEHIE